MKRYTKLNIILMAILAVAMFASGCDDKQVAEANKLVDSANKKMNDAKPLMTKASETFSKISDKVQDFDEGKKAHEAELKELLTSYDKILELYKGAAADFGGASKLNSDATFKAYYDMSQKDMENSAALVSQNKVLVQAFIDAKTAEDYSKKLDEIKAKNDDLKKEGDDIAAKLKKLEADVNAKNK